MLIFSSIHRFILLLRHNFICKIVALLWKYSWNRFARLIFRPIILIWLFGFCISFSYQHIIDGVCSIAIGGVSVSTVLWSLGGGCSFWRFMDNRNCCEGCLEDIVMFLWKNQLISDSKQLSSSAAQTNLPNYLPKPQIF